MKKHLRSFFLLLSVSILLGGCQVRATEQPAVPVRVVTQIDIEAAHDPALQRCYTAPQKLEAVLSYLRLLRFRGSASALEVRGERFDIRIRYSDGSSRTVFQFGRQYLRRSDGWEYIDPAQGRLLQVLLQHLPSDA